MMLLVLVFLLQLSTAAFVAAGPVYVKPSSEVVVRRGQGTDFKIIAMVKDGTQLELVEESGDYARVRLANGNEGWMLKRFLSTSPPIAERYEKLQEEFDALEQEARKTQADIKLLNVELEKANEEIVSLAGQRDQLQKEYNQIVEDTADVVKIQQRQEQTAQENSSLKQRLSVAEQENATLANDRTLYWFLAGAGVFLVGLLIGKMPSPSRRRKSSLL